MFQGGGDSDLFFPCHIFLWRPKLSQAQKQLTSICLTHRWVRTLWPMSMCLKKRTLLLSQRLQKQGLTCRVRVHLLRQTIQGQAPQSEAKAWETWRWVRPGVLCWFHTGTADTGQHLDKKHSEETCDGRCFERKQDFRKPLGTTRKEQQGRGMALLVGIKKLTAWTLKSKNQQAENHQEDRVRRESWRPHSGSLHASAFTTPWTLRA